MLADTLLLIEQDITTVPPVALGEPGATAAAGKLPLPDTASKEDALVEVAALVPALSDEHTSPEATAVEGVEDVPPVVVVQEGGERRWPQSRGTRGRGALLGSGRLLEIARDPKTSCVLPLRLTTTPRLWH